MNRWSVKLSLLVCGVLAQGCASEKYSEYEIKTDLLFPLKGESLILTGGRSREQNPFHILVKDQRYAIDVIALQPGAEPPGVRRLIERVLIGELTVHRDDFSKNEDHYCFGREVMAPGDGVVSDVKDGIIDNIPGERNPKEVPGNFVVIDHGNGEFSMIAHLQEGSVLVNKGDIVQAGMVIGRCGNSGNSAQPHLHYHLQNTPRWLDGHGLPLQFRNYYSNGRRVERGEPIQGEIISHTLRVVK